MDSEDKDFKISALYGSTSNVYGGAGGNPFSLNCDTFVNKIRLEEENEVSNIGIDCDSAPSTIQFFESDGRTWNGGVMDYDSVTDISACRRMCFENPNCTFYEYNNNNCWLINPNSPSAVGSSTIGLCDRSGTSFFDSNRLVKTPISQSAGSYLGTSRGEGSCPKGFNRMMGSAGQYINRLDFFCDGYTSPAVGAGYQTSSNINFTCPDGQVINKIWGRDGSLIDQIIVACKYRKDCESANNVFDPDCASWRTSTPTNDEQYKTMVASYCGQENHMEESKCQSECERGDINCDSAINSYCSRFSTDQILSDPTKTRICACHLDASDSAFYDRYWNAISGGDPLVKSRLAGSVRCTYPKCATALRRQAEKNDTCPDIKLVNCIQNINFGNLNLTDSEMVLKINQACQIVEPPPVVPPPVVPPVIPVVPPVVEPVIPVVPIEEPTPPPIVEPTPIEEPSSFNIKLLLSQFLTKFSSMSNQNKILFLVLFSIAFVLLLF